MSNQGSIDVSIKDGIGTIEFSHPLSNSLPGKLLADLTENIVNAGHNNSINVIVLKSSGDRAFCAGASFDELLSIEDAVSAKEFFSGFANVINAMRTCPKLIIGRVQGKSVGGGVGLAAASDYCFATMFAAIKLSELSIGFGPFVIGPAVERKMGLAAMSQMTINASSWKSAVWAEEHGLFSEVYDTTEVMDDAIYELARTLSKCSPEAMKGIKEMLWHGTDDWGTLLYDRAEVSGNLILSDFTKEALMKFRGK